VKVSQRWRIASRMALSIIAARAPQGKATPTLGVS
jgi:hypothetical protein